MANILSKPNRQTLGKGEKEEEEDTRENDGNDGRQQVNVTDVKFSPLATVKVPPLR